MCASHHGGANTDGVKNATVLAAASPLVWIARSPSVARRRMGALAYGTGTVPAVDKIVGPGNALCGCSQAPRVWSGRHRHDRRTVGDSGDRGRNANPDWVAMDLFSQAEHDEVAQSILLTPE